MIQLASVKLKNFNKKKYADRHIIRGRCHRDTHINIQDKICSKEIRWVTKSIAATWNSIKRKGEVKKEISLNNFIIIKKAISKTVMDRRCRGWFKQLRWRRLALTFIKCRPTQTTLQVTKAPLETTTQISTTTIFIAAKKVTIIVLKIAITKIALRIVEEKKIIVVHWANEITIAFKKVIRVQ